MIAQSADGLDIPGRAIGSARVSCDARIDLGVQMAAEGPAATVAQVIAGGLAFVQLAEPEMAEVARAIRISQNGDRLTLTLQASREMLEMVMESQLGGRAADRGDDGGQDAGAEADEASGEPMAEVRALESALDEVRAELRQLRDGGGRAGRATGLVFRA